MNIIFVVVGALIGLAIGRKLDAKRHVTDREAQNAARFGQLRTSANIAAVLPTQTFGADPSVYARPNPVTRPSLDFRFGTVTIPELFPSLNGR